MPSLTDPCIRLKVSGIPRVFANTGMSSFRKRNSALHSLLSISDQIFPILHTEIQDSYIDLYRIRSKIPRRLSLRYHDIRQKHLLHP